ncbi:hypothetical protein LIER_20946 [Lithospermum erythrorhizon]|uniref:HMA domain-containing protein n=1 Tax=Lithospermum erythrorhizon TaxID=34254 RepID=A0AAV3QQT0_LITER
MKTEVKIDSIHDQKVKTKVLKVISKLTGVDNISVDREKRIVTIVGDVDPIKLVSKIRKIADCVEVVTVGPPKKPDEKKPDEKKPDEKKPCCYCNQLSCCCIATLPSSCIQPQARCFCRQCQLVAVCVSDYDSPGPCTIV